MSGIVGVGEIIGALFILLIMYLINNTFPSNEGESGIRYLCLLSIVITIWWLCAWL